MGNVTAFVLDESVAVGDEGATIPGVPGIWHHDRPVLAAALEYTVQELRDAIDTLGLPLKEVKVSEQSAHLGFPEQHNRLESARELPRGAGEQDAPELEQVQAPDPNVLDETLDRATAAEEEPE